MQTILFLLGLSVILLIRNTKKKILYRKVPVVNNAKNTILGNSFYKIPYLIRYTIFKCKYFYIKIHKALISDPDDLHDHPWNYISIILWGGYWEETKHTGEGYNSEYRFTTRKWYSPLSILKRRGDKPHKLIIPEGKYSISLIFVGRRYRNWSYHRDGRGIGTVEECTEMYFGKSVTSSKETLRRLTQKETSWLIPHQIKKQKETSI